MDGAQHFRTENVNVIEIIFRARALINSDNLFSFICFKISLSVNLYYKNNLRFIALTLHLQCRISEEHRFIFLK